MKKLLIILLTCSAGYTYAQPINFGVKGGANFTTVKKEGQPNMDYKTGFHLGVLAHIHMDDKLALQPEISYSQHGGKDKNNSNIKLNLNYVNIPILLQYMFADGFRIQTGPQFGILTGAKLEVGNVESDVKTSFKSLDVAIPLGISYLSNSGFGADARWLFGLSDINDVQGIAKTTNSGAQVGVFYLFGSKPGKKRR